MKKIVLLLLLLSFTQCQKKNLLSYEVVFEGKLGFEVNEIGSNVPILRSYSNRQGLPNEMLLDIPSHTIHDEKLYFADSYNKKISVFSIRNLANSDLLMSINNTGENYSFARPYHVYVNNDKFIYVLASVQDIESYEVQNHSNQTAQIQNYRQFQENLSNIPLENFYIYKFSPQGRFLYRIGSLGINTNPMVYPSRISGDNFGNLYVTTNPPILDNENPFFLIRRYSESGELNFEFSSESITITTNLDNVAYNGKIIMMDNFKNSERLLSIIEYQPTTNDKGEEVPALIDNIWSSLSSYSILENEFNETLITNKQMTESILGIDKDDKIYLQSYDTEINTLRLHIFDAMKKKSQYYFTPIFSLNYELFDYFIDDDGNAYNPLLDRDKLLILRWNIQRGNE